MSFNCLWCMQGKCTKGSVRYRLLLLTLFLFSHIFQTCSSHNFQGVHVLSPVSFVEPCLDRQQNQSRRIKTDVNCRSPSQKWRPLTHHVGNFTPAAIT